MQYHKYLVYLYHSLTDLYFLKYCKSRYGTMIRKLIFVIIMHFDDDLFVVHIIKMLVLTFQMYSWLLFFLSNLETLDLIDIVNVFIFNVCRRWLNTVYTNRSLVFDVYKIKHWMWGEQSLRSNLKDHEQLKYKLEVRGRPMTECR